MTKILSKQDIQLHNMASTYNFPLFWYNGRLFRSYISEEESVFQKVLSLNLPEVQTATLSEFELDLNGFDKSGKKSPVYEHKNYTHRVRINEIFPELVKKCIIAICDMNIQLTQHNMIVVDTHEANFNITIDGIKWLDYGSIREISGLLPLRSFVEVGYLIGKYILNKYHDSHESMNVYIVKTFDPFLEKIADEDFSKSSSWVELKLFVENLSIPELKYGHWSDEYTLESDIDRPESRNDKGKNYWSLLQEIDFETVTDIACNKGYYSFLAAKKARSVIGFDYVPKCISMAYELNKTFKLPVIFAAKSVEDFIANKHFETSRFKSDLVVALAIVHHIKVSPLEFVKMIDSICNKYVIIEDITDAPGYEALFVQQGYELVKRIDSSPSPRTLSLYKKL